MNEILCIIIFHTKMTPLIYSIEGNIGAGKTTLLEQIEAIGHYNVYVLREPVDMWTLIRDSEGENILEKFYKDPKTYAFPFQVLAFHTRLETLTKTIAENPICNIILCERSLHADGHIFAKMLYDDGMIDEISYRIYQKMYLDGIAKFPLSGAIYLDVEPEVCAERIVKRGRVGEESISLDYLQRCHDYHASWLNVRQPYPVIKYKSIENLFEFIQGK